MTYLLGVVEQHLVDIFLVSDGAEPHAFEEALHRRHRHPSGKG
ncbi:MAG: hypothetical protein ACRDTN_21190 [Mycobacterium sp.]